MMNNKPLPQLWVLSDVPTKRENSLFSRFVGTSLACWFPNNVLWKSLL